MRSKKTFLFLIMLLLIDIWSTWWLHTHMSGLELNPVIRILLQDPILYFAGKSFLSCVVLVCIYRLRSQSIRVFRWSSMGACVVFSIACINNLIGVVVMV